MTFVDKLQTKMIPPDRLWIQVTDVPGFHNKREAVNVISQGPWLPFRLIDFVQIEIMDQYN